MIWWAGSGAALPKAGARGGRPQTGPAAPGANAAGPAEVDARAVGAYGVGALGKTCRFTFDNDLMTISTPGPWGGKPRSTKECARDRAAFAADRGNLP